MKQPSADSAKNVKPGDFETVTTASQVLAGESRKGDIVKNQTTPAARAHEKGKKEANR